ncbi:MAG: hypothetical protein FWC61_00715 [Proteobacteria bacterium]|nr:hypothetical protein [Pseudomonadota bacterium]
MRKFAPIFGLIVGLFVTACGAAFGAAAGVANPANPPNPRGAANAPSAVAAPTAEPRTESPARVGAAAPGADTRTAGPNAAVTMRAATNTGATGGAVTPRSVIIPERTSAPARAAIARPPAPSTMGISARTAAMQTPARAPANVAARAAALTVANASPTYLTSKPDLTIAGPISFESSTYLGGSGLGTKGNLVDSTSVGAAYDRCKTAYFTCMDQFCAVKNPNYQRCSCSDRILDLTTAQNVMQDANEELTKFNENLDTVGMTGPQASAMKTASEGENALTGDASAAKALLQAIMNSIKGTDATVGGKYAPLNTISFNIDPSLSFGFGDIGQAIAAYNGKNLYSITYGQCRQAVGADCTDAALQRAVTAYLMAIENDCNVVQKMNSENQRKLTASVRQSGAMLELARIQNRQQHNSSDMAECLSAVEKAITSEEVCGANYYRCLDNGKFIDIATGRPIIGVVDFYKLGSILVFNKGVALEDQRLTKIAANRPFVDNFVSRTKKFAAPALDKCTENADTVWADYLDRAMIDIFYAQQAKVQEIRTGCMDFVSQCYMTQEQSLTAAMVELVNTATTVAPDLIKLTDALCTDYVASCDNMFGGNIIALYITTGENSRTNTDTKTACRAAMQQCFKRFGGTDYVNFYSKYSGLFTDGHALDWFSIGKSQCWMQLCSIAACRGSDSGGVPISQVDCNDGGTLADTDLPITVFGGFKISASGDYVGPSGSPGHYPAGVATEIFNTILDTLVNQCTNLYGRFVERQYLYVGNSVYNNPSNWCIISVGDICPYGYVHAVDTDSWGICSCHETQMSSCNGSQVRCISDPATQCPP